MQYLDTSLCALFDTSLPDLFFTICYLVLQDLADKIASLNAAIDDVSAQLKAQDSVPETAGASATAT